MAVPPKIQVIPAMALVVASMIGTGVFTSLGYQVRDLPSGPVIMVVWLLGGLLALCGAFSYAEIASALPRSGGEYHFLSKIYHPSIGFAAGVISSVIGFSAPTALAAIALGRYAHRALGDVPALAASVLAILLVTAGHLITLRSSAVLQTASTSLKLLLIVGFIIVSFSMPGKGDIRWLPEPSTDIGLILQPAFGIALLFVFYAYSGWNAAVYILDEIHDARRTVVRALVFGTVLVMALYLLLNMAFLKAAPVAELAGVTEVGYVAAGSLFGAGAARWFSGLLALGLVATLSALVWAGPRILQVMGKDFPALGFLAGTNKQGLPVVATLVQSALALLFIGTGTFEQLLTYAQFGLTLSAFLTVFGLFILRVRRDTDRAGFRCPWFPVPPAIFLGMTGFVMIRSIFAEPLPTAACVATLIAAWLLYFPLRKGRLAQHQSPK